MSMLDRITAQSDLPSPREMSSAIPSAQDKKNIIDQLKANFDQFTYDGLMQEVMVHLPTLATHRNCFTRTVAKVFQTELPNSLQEAIVILTLKAHPEYNNDVSKLTSEDIRGVVNDMVLKGHNEHGHRIYRDGNQSVEEYKHGIIDTLEYSPYRELKTHFSAGIERLVNFHQVVSPELTVLPFSDDHYTFFSTKTHVASGLIALTFSGSGYSRQTSASTVLSAIKVLYDKQLERESSELKLTVNNKSVNGVLKDIDDALACHVIADIFPEDGADKQQIIAFYRERRVLKFTVKNKLNTKGQFELAPVLVHDRENNRHYLHFELSKIGVQGDPQPNSVMFNFCGNACNHEDQFYSAIRLVHHTNVKQIIPMYPNKGINSLLNPDLYAATTSIKGSVNPHIMAYNYLAEQNLEIDLQVYAFSYGNFASAKFIERIRETEPNKPILFIGSGTASSLIDVARDYVGKAVGDVVDELKLLNNADVFETLNDPQITAMIFNDPSDKIIGLDAQIQQHPNFDESGIHFVNEKLRREEVQQKELEDKDDVERMRLIKKYESDAKDRKFHSDCVHYDPKFDEHYWEMYRARFMKNQIIRRSNSTV